MRKTSERDETYKLTELLNVYSSGGFIAGSDMKNDSEFGGNSHELTLVKERVQSEYGAPRTGQRKEKILPLNKIFPRITYDKPTIPQ